MKSQRPFEVSAVEYPFTDHWMELKGTKLHYVDEGQGVPVILLHGNPTWSFLYRNIIKNLNKKVRSIAVDYPGFGFSEHPANYSYEPQAHAEYVKGFVQKLNLDRYVIVVQDWGGPIGMELATSAPEKVAGLVILNTWSWKASPILQFFSMIMGSSWAYRKQIRENFFVNTTLPNSSETGVLRRPEILKAYVDQFPTPEKRVGPAVLPRAIRTSRVWLESLEKRLVTLNDKPVELVWAMKDPAFGRESVIKKWLSYFPQARVTRIAKANHYIQEDAPQEIAEAILRVVNQLT